MCRFISVQFVPMRDTFCMVVLRFVCATRIIPVFFRVLKHLCMLFPTAYLLFQTVVTAVSFMWQATLYKARLHLGHHSQQVSSLLKEVQTRDHIPYCFVQSTRWKEFNEES